MELTIREFLKQNKRLVGPVVLFILAFFIVLRVIIPLFSNISEERAKLATEEQRLADLRSTQQAIQEINADNIENNITLAQSALPQNKDIILIYSTIVDLATKNEMEVDSFGVQVGQIYDKEGEAEAAAPPPEPDPTAQGGQFPALTVSVKLSSDDPDKLFAFSKQVMQVLPLSSVKTISTDDQVGSYDLSFYYKPLNAAALQEQEFVTPLSETEKQTLKTIQNYSNND